MTSDKLLGTILAGGQSRRFGSDKAEAKIDGKRLIDLVAEALEPQVDALVVCGRKEDKFTCIEDQPEAGIGPLGGLLAALKFAAQNGHPAILSTGCDVPDLPADIAKSLSGETAAIVEHQPVIGFWPVALADTLEQFIADGERALYKFADHVDARRVVLDNPLANVNRPQDLKQLRRK